MVAQSTSPSPNSQPEPLKFDLLAQVNRTHLLTPTLPTVTDTINIDDADEVNIGFGSPSKTLKIELISPSGQRFSSGNINTGGVKSRIFPDPNDPSTTGLNYIFVLTRPQAGKWTYIIADTVPLTKNRGVLMDMFSSSLVRAGMLSTYFNNRANSDVYLSLTVADDQNILKNPSIKATVAKVDDSNFSEATVNFLDDGANGDATAGDGLFTASFKSQVSGEFQAFADITGTTSRGTAFQRNAYTAFKVNPDLAHFLGSFTNRGIDTDGDGLFNQIGISPTVQVLEAGKYDVQMTLTASNGESITAHKLFDLPTGNVTPEVTFNSEDVKNFLKVNGAYVVSKAFIFSYNDLAISVDRAYNLGNTEPYQIAQLQREAIEASGTGSAVGIDTNSNGKFDYLDVTISTNLLKDGDYNWSARLVDQNDNQIALASGSDFLSAGNASVKLRFNGAAIGNSKANSPYYVKNLIVYGGGQSLRASDALTIQNFTASQFEGFVSPDNEPPKLSVSVTPNTLYPPNHQMVEIKVNTTVSDNIDPNPTVSLLSITSNEGQNVRGDGNTSTDIQTKPNGQVFLRAERSGTGTGRIYTLTYQATDAAGNISQATAEVKVPHNKGK
ncbi:choice-of-anchor X domain-containing protein [Synechocystis sp. PCC 7509]|uniref:choice-of-anchor X domain-containing protein n=1 Tax=Synechocystis sp. PCC 7509 TaxID=927677 RepID=UPI0002AC5D3A|nr:choice-of-anchor X domain-containing protein [Synechocystis sp. PCC 7509]